MQPMLTGLHPILMFFYFLQPNFLLHKTTNKQRTWANAFEHLLYLGAKIGVVSKRDIFIPRSDVWYNHKIGFIA